MARRNYSRTRALEEKWRAQGRGQGERLQYRPWLTVQDVPSDGWTIQPPGWLVDRDYALLSKWEYYYFLTLEWAAMTHHTIWDIREQFPLPWVDDTVQLAEKLGIAHPVDRTSGEPLTLTTDFMITLTAGSGARRLVARTVKESADLHDIRTLEKLEIERQYYQEREIDWGPVTEQQMSLTLAQNVEFIHDAREYSIDSLPRAQAPMVAEAVGRALRGASEGLATTCLSQDRRLGLEPGTSLALVRHQIANGWWVVDMHTPLDLGAPLTFRQSSTAADQGA